MDQIAAETLAETLIDRLTGIVGDAGITTDADDLEPHVTERRGRYRGTALAMVRPASTEQVAEVVRQCRRAGVAIVPQGGNTSLVGGSIPFEEGRSVIVGLGRMNRVRELDADNDTLTVEAGCILADIQAAAAEADRLFPLSLGAEGTCQIGGNLSTNAGGISVLRYGNARELVLGLEVVLPDGRVWDGLRGLRKDNTGYDLKQLFVGAEGTVGIVTAAVLKLFPRPRETATALAGVASAEAALALLGRARSAVGDGLVSFELICRRGLEFALRHVPDTADPLADPHPWYVLIEATSPVADGRLAGAVETFLGAALESGLVADATLAQSEAQRAGLWRLREGVVEGQRHEGGSIKHDVAVPVSKVPVFLERATAAVEAAIPGVRPVPFGHLGDGNIHFNLSQPEGADTAAYLARWEEINHLVHDIVSDLRGSISAEHGVGRMKVAEIAERKSAVEIDLMRAVKRALDPDNLMNPGKVVT